MNNNLRIIPLVVFTVIFLSSFVYFSAPVTSSVQQVNISSPTVTSTPTLKLTSTPKATNTPLPTSTNTPSPVPTSTPSPTVTLNEFSPEDIARVIREKSLNDLWKIWRGPQKTPFVNFISSDGDYSVQRLYIETNDPEIEYAILVIGEQEYKRTWLYMLFKREGDVWQFLDYLELHSKYSIEPSYQVIDVDGENFWLVVRLLANSGTGFALYEQHWHKLNSDEFKTALRYPVSGHEIHSWGPTDVWFNGELERYGPNYDNMDVYSIDVIFRAEYRNSFENITPEELPRYYPLFYIERKARYLWDEERERFVLDSGESDVTEYQVEKLFHYDATEFVQFTYDELLKLAATGDKYQKKWLQLVLEQAQDSERKDNLIKQLQM